MHGEDRDAKSVASNLHDREMRISLQASGDLYRSKSFVADHTDLDAFRSARGHDQRDHPGIWKVCEVHLAIRLVQLQMMRKFYELQARTNKGELIVGDGQKNGVGDGFAGGIGSLSRTQPGRF